MTDAQMTDEQTDALKDIRDIRERAYQELFDVINWIAYTYPEEWKKYMKEYPGHGNWGGHKSEDGKPLFPLKCVNCGNKEYFTAGEGSKRVPICEECRKTRVQK